MLCRLRILSFGFRGLANVALVLLLLSQLICAHGAARVRQARYRSDQAMHCT